MMGMARMAEECMSLEGGNEKVENANKKQF